MLLKLGVDVRSVPPGLPEMCDNYMVALYRKWEGGRSAFMCELNKCVVFNGFSFADEGWHPFAEVLQQCREHSKLSYEDTLLRRFYDVWQPVNAKEALIVSLTRSKALEKYPSYAYVLPWEYISFRDRMTSVRKIVRRESLSGNPLGHSTEDGFPHHGPVSVKTGIGHLHRCAIVYESVRKEGYLREKGHLYVTSLKRGRAIRFLVRQGIHRAAAIAALGCTHVPAIPRYGALVDRDHASNWPQVVNGMWDEQDAKDYFDHLFDFDSRSWALRKLLLHDRR